MRASPSGQRDGGRRRVVKLEKRALRRRPTQPATAPAGPGWPPRKTPPRPQHGGHAPGDVEVVVGNPAARAATSPALTASSPRNVSQSRHASEVESFFSSIFTRSAPDEFPRWP